METERKIEDLRDEVMALRFAFMTLVRALHRQGTLPIPAILEQLQAVAEQVGADFHELTGVAEQLHQLRGALFQLQ